MGKGRPPTPIKTRFWAKVRKGSTPNSCWLFISNHGGMDYGALSVKLGNEYLAHRISWEIHFGKIPKGALVLHKCDTPKCVNPSHLFLGSHADNMNDMVSKGRDYHGERCHLHKLKTSEVKEMRDLYKTGKYKQIELARMFGLGKMQTHRILNGTARKHG